ncbi:PAC2 family protein [Rhizoctonia solani AG-3 Rhs1AP]|uniref:Proteasome assembly chaperone 2 n=2 Tax=Rhizoctonia solani AG-3 TaxID=1086053 RepID=A0A074RVX1_9AGAM|nr:PAC2 family protein [Rhizoctonia solani AG-3 Rhs1AP]KEP49475.1 PAC2 family protein [Rhizoctonia solani 123E]
MSDRPFFRLSSGPGLPTEKSNTVLIVPVVSAGNVSQLCADLLIHTLLLRQVGIFDPGYYAPAVGGQDGEHSTRISTPMELFGLPGGDIFVLQQRSPVLKDRKEEFVSKLLQTIDSSGFGSVLYLVGSDQSARTDAQMGSNCYVILAKDTTRDSIISTPLAGLLELPPLGHSLADQLGPETSVIPGTGLARRLLRASGATPSIALIQYVAEGDNIPDAHAMAAAVAETLKIQIQEWTQPPSWKCAMFGMPADQQLFG